MTSSVFLMYILFLTGHLPDLNFLLTFFLNKYTLYAERVSERKLLLVQTYRRYITANLHSPCKGEERQKYDTEGFGNR